MAKKGKTPIQIAIKVAMDQRRPVIPPHTPHAISHLLAKSYVVAFFALQL